MHQPLLKEMVVLDIAMPDSLGWNLRCQLLRMRMRQASTMPTSNPNGRLHVPLIHTYDTIIMSSNKKPFDSHSFTRHLLDVGMLYLRNYNCISFASHWFFLHDKNKNLRYAYVYTWVSHRTSPSEEQRFLGILC